MPTYNVTNDGSSAYLFTGEEFGSTPTPNPTIDLIPGETYTFNVSAVGHPFYIKTEPVSGTSDTFNSGVTNNGVEDGTLTFVVPIDAPETLYYACEFHSSMQGILDVLLPTYNLSSSKFLVNEGESVTFTLTTTNVEDGTFVPYTITGISSLDLESESLIGNFEVVSNSSTETITLKNDLLTEGPETLTLSLDDSTESISVNVNDTSQNPSATYELFASPNPVDEGQTVTITLQTTNVPNGIEIPYTISSADADDFDESFSSLGVFTVTNNNDSFSLNIIEDFIPEGTETFTVSLDNGEASIDIDINDTSNAPGENALYLLSADSDEIDEGQSVTITLTTQEVGDGTEVPYTIQGISSEDLVSGELTGNFVIQDGQSSITFTAVEDFLEEGNEALTINLNNGESFTTVVINDTSVPVVPPQPEYTLFTDNDTIFEGQRTFIYLETKNIPEGTQVPFFTTGLAEIQSFFVVDEDGKAFEEVFAVKDSETEGTETLNIILTDDPSKSVTITILDTSYGDELESSEPPTLNELINVQTPNTDFPKYFVSNQSNEGFIFSGEEFINASGINPQLTLDRGKTYEFIINTPGFPFSIKTTDETGLNFSNRFYNGVKNQNIELGVLTFQVPEEAPDVLYYMSELQQNMVGIINVVGEVEEGELEDLTPVKNPYQKYVNFISSGTYNSGTTYVVEKKDDSTYFFNQGEFFYGIENPTLYLVRGNTYTFRVFGENHIFNIKTQPTTGFGFQYNLGVTNNGITEGTLVFEVSKTAPDTLYYQCSYNENLFGEIKIFDKGESLPERNPYHKPSSDVPPQITPEGNLVRQELSKEEVKFHNFHGNLGGKRITGRKTTVKNYNGYFPKFVQVQPEPYKESLKDQYDIILSEDQFVKYSEDAILYEPVEYRFWFDNPFLVVSLDTGEKKVFYLTKESINLDNLYHIYWNNEAIYFRDDTTFAYLYFWSEDDVTLENEQVTFN